MKIKIIDQNRTERVIENAGKGMILQKKIYEDISLSEPEIDSIGSSIQVINGSFSNLKPIEGEIQTSSPGLSNFKPTVTSTPIINEYEESEGEQPKKKNNNISEDLNLTFNFQEDVLSEKGSCEKYMHDLVQFISKTQNVVEDKLIKRTLLLKKISKYQKKIRNMEKSIRRIDKIIHIGSELPKLCEDLF